MNIVSNHVVFSRDIIRNGFLKGSFIHAIDNEVEAVETRNDKDPFDSIEK